jgi:pimeloyl-ACP methyl ester carboxylesterase
MTKDNVMTRQTSPTAQIEIKDLPANGLTFRCRVSGMENHGEPVIFLHGFPETSHLWEEVMRSLATQGYRCLAPDQRGYSPSARPKDVKQYAINELAADVIALADSVGFAKFHLVGHDWGAGCGWTVVQRYPERVQSWSALSIPHLAAFETAKQTDADQRRRSWYMGFFQMPRLPEFLLGLAARGKSSSLWASSSAQEVSDYQTVFRSFEGRKASLDWYRANRELPNQYGAVYLPTLLIWGNQDIAVGRAGIEMTRQYMKGEYTLLELEAGHALVQEQFEQVNHAIYSHIHAHPIQPEYAELH